MSDGLSVATVSGPNGSMLLRVERLGHPAATVTLHRNERLRLAMDAMLPGQRLVGMCRDCQFFGSVVRFDEEIEREYGDCQNVVTVSEFEGQVYPEFGCIYWEAKHDGA